VAVIMAQVTPKIPIASVRGGDPKLTITDKDWQRIQVAYGSELSPDLRKEIYEATIRFLQFVPFEQAAQPVLIARQKIKRVFKAATDLQKAILEHPQSDAGDATLYANRLINRYFDDGSITDRDKLGFLGKLMGPLSTACSFALEHLDNHKNHGRREGEAWRLWVQNLKSILAAKGLPTEVRKDTDKNRTGNPSPFVAFIHELQACVPETFRRSIQSDGALAQSIYESGRLVRREAKSGPTISYKSRKRRPR
jgi:hypothetical protein